MRDWSPAAVFAMPGVIANCVTENFEPVSLTTVIYRVMENVVLAQFFQYLAVHLVLRSTRQGYYACCMEVLEGWTRVTKLKHVLLNIAGRLLQQIMAWFLLRRCGLASGGRCNSWWRPPLTGRIWISAQPGMTSRAVF